MYDTANKRSEANSEEREDDDKKERKKREQGLFFEG